MPKYRYKSITAEGGSLSGTYIASSKDDVLKMLRANNSYPVLVEEDNVLSSTGILKLWGIKPKEYAVMCRQLFAMINAGVPIIQSLNILRAQVTHKEFKEGIDQVYEDVQKGQSLSAAMKKHRKVFPELMVNMLEAGELSGAMDSVLERLANHYEREAKISNKIKSAMVYPIVLSFAVIAVVTFMMMVVMPTFVGLFESSGAALPWPTRVVIGMSKAMSNYWYLFLFGAIALVWGLVRYINTPAGRLHFDELKLSLPVVKGLNQKIASSRFSRTLSTMLASGIPLIQALENIENVIGNKVISNGIQNVREEVQKGSDLAGPISRIKDFPPMVASMIHVGEESGTLDDILKKTAEFYDEEVTTEIDRVLALFEPMMILVMGVIVGFIVIAMLMPMFNLASVI